MKSVTFSLCRCTFEEACTNSAWLSIPEQSRHKMVSHQVVKNADKVLMLLQLFAYLMAQVKMLAVESTCLV